MLKLKGKDCLVVGGGSVGERKVRMLLEVGAEVYLIAKDVNQNLKKLISDGNVRYLGKEFHREAITGKWLVFAATSDRKLNKRIAKFCCESGIFCNCATDPELSSFVVPASHRSGRLVVSVGTSAASPALAAKIRDFVADMLQTGQWHFYLAQLERIRHFIQKLGLSSEANQKVFRFLAEVVYSCVRKQAERSKSLIILKDSCEKLLKEVGAEYPADEWEKLWKV